MIDSSELFKNKVHIIAKETAMRIGASYTNVDKVFFVWGIRETLKSLSPFEQIEDKNTVESSCYLLILFHENETRNLGDIEKEIQMDFSTDCNEVVAICEFINDANKSIKIGARFYSTICTPKFLLFEKDGLKMEFCSDDVLKGSLVPNLEKHWKDTLSHACNFLIDAQSNFDRDNLRQAAMLAHKAVVYFMIASIYNAIQYLATPQTKLLKLKVLTLIYSGRLYDVFPMNTAEDEKILGVLILADEEVWWQYDSSSKKNEIQIILERVKLFKVIVQDLYNKKIEIEKNRKH